MASDSQKFEESRCAGAAFVRLDWPALGGFAGALVSTS